MTCENPSYHYNKRKKKRKKEVHATQEMLELRPYYILGAVWVVGNACIY